MPMPLFPLGDVVITPGALEAFERAGAATDPPRMPALVAFAYLIRHTSGDWGDLDEYDQQQNALALQDGSRLMSAYTLTDQTRIWVITEAVGDDGHRAATTLLLPDEY